MRVGNDYFLRCFKYTPDDELKRALEQKIFNNMALEAVQQTLDNRRFKMSANLYVHYKKMFDETKPIRGRSVDVRPIGQRRRDWELIEMDGDVVACKLYNTQVVRYYPDGRVGLRCGGWPTPLTADFIHTHSPWQCIKRYNKLWVSVRDETGEHRSYPIPSDGELTFERVNDCWRATTEVKLKKSVIDREKSKQAREPVKPFLSWAKSFLAMSDGWVMHETRKQVQGISMNGWTYEHSYMEDKGIYELMKSSNPDDYMLALCVLLDPRQGTDERRSVVDTQIASKDKQFRATWSDTRYTYEYLRGRVDRVVKSAVDVYTTVEVEIGAKMQTGIA